MAQVWSTEDWSHEVAERGDFSANHLVGLLVPLGSDGVELPIRRYWPHVRRAKEMNPIRAMLVHGDARELYHQQTSCSDGLMPNPVGNDQEQIRSRKRDEFPRRPEDIAVVGYKASELMALLQSDENLPVLEALCETGIDISKSHQADAAGPGQRRGQHGKVLVEHELARLRRLG